MYVFLQIRKRYSFWVDELEKGALSGHMSTFLQAKAPAWQSTQLVEHKLNYHAPHSLNPGGSAQTVQLHRTGLWKAQAPPGSCGSS